MVGKKCACALIAVIGLVSAKSEIRAQGFYFDLAPKQVIVKSVQRYLAINVRNDSGEAISLSVRGIPIADIPAGGQAVVRALEGQIEMEAFKHSSKAIVRQTIHEHRDFNWIVPQRLKVVKVPEPRPLRPIAYLEAVIPAATVEAKTAEPRVAQPIQAIDGTLGDEQVIRPRNSDSEKFRVSEPRRIQNPIPLQ